MLSQCTERGYKFTEAVQEFSFLLVVSGTLLTALCMKLKQVYVACLIKLVLIMPMNINNRNLKIGVKFNICILCSPLCFVGGSSTEYETCSGIA